MRPVALDLEGFAAFRDRTAVDFAGADLFAIVGATGHGKSSLIDAVSFALYGKVPRHGERDIAPVMTLGCNETKVSFTFEAGGATYRATRVLRRKPGGEGATTRALRLEVVHDDGTLDVLAGKKDEFDAAVQQLVGLDFEQFTKCVVLPQGQFASFLHARSGERVAILSALLDLGRYERMAAAARSRRDAAAGEARVLAAQREQLAAATPEALAHAQERCDALGALRAEVDAAAPRDADLAREVETARAAAQTAAGAAGALAAVRVPEELRDVVQQIDTARANAELAARAADAADARASEADAALEAHPPLEELRAAAEAHVARAELLERVEKGEALLAEQAEALAQADGALAAARELLAGAQAALDDAQHRHAHAELRASLHTGEPCPVCEQPVAVLPPKLRATELTAARKAHAAAEKERRRAEEHAQTVRTTLAQTTERLAARRETLAELDARVAAHPDARALIPRLELVTATQEQAVQARAEAKAARAAAHDAANASQAFAAELARADAALQQQRDALVAAGLDPPRPETKAGLAAAWDALAAWADDTRPEHEKLAAELDDVAAARRAERDALRSDLEQRAAGLGTDVSTVSAVADLVLAVADAQHEAAEARRTIAEQLERAALLDAGIAAARADEQLAAELGRLLDKGHFGQWLVDEALRGLVAGASTLLDRLSGGQYALTTNADGELLVVDRVNADETRSVRSLSGGETFQASLALALALADRIADLASDGAARLESIFLDEGFGTLDPETLEVVAGTIESLGTDERVVGVVTHVPALAERMPVRFRVRKVGRTSTVTREES